MLLSVCLTVFAAHAGEGEFKAYTELTYVFNSGFYPAAISQADDFISTYDRSSFMADVQTIKGESLFRLGRYAEAAFCLEKQASRSADASYWLGRSRFALNQYNDAAAAFYQTLALTGTETGDEELVRSTIVYAAFSLSNAGDKEQAASLLQLAFARYEMAEDLVPSAALLFSLYQSLSRHDATVALYQQLEEVIPRFQDELKEAVMISAARSFAETGNLQKAWELCVGLVQDGSRSILTEALQEAWELSEEEPSYDISQLLEGAESKLAEYPEYRSEMWLRLGIASFEKGELDRSEVFLERAEQTASQEQKNLSAVYRSEILLERGESALGLSLLEKATFTGSPWYADSLVQMARCAAFSGNERVAAAYVQKLEFTLPEDKETDPDVIFWEMWAATRNRSWNAVQTLYGRLPDGVIHPEAAVLFSNALMVTDPADAAAERAALELEHAGDIRNACAAFLLSGQYDRVLADTEGCQTGSDISYLRGLALLTKGRWSEAAASLGTDNPWALYYTAYALYRAGNSKDAYNTFTRFIKENPVHKMSYEANLTAALCALQNGSASLALEPAAKACTFAATEKQRIESHLQYALICKELGKLSEAIQSLEQDMNSVSQAAVPLKFQLADYYAEAGRLGDADALLVKTESLLSGNPLAEETAFRRAELYFARNMWNEAGSRFSACRKNYPSGTAAARALYYNALCCENGGNVDSAILMYEACRTQNGAELYDYSCLAHLVPLYRASGEVNSALRLAGLAVAAYPEAAAQDGIPEMISELKLLAEGADEKTARLLARYNAMNGTASVEGRAAGAELARQYLDAYSRWEQGVGLLEEIASAIPEEAGYDDMMTGNLVYGLLGRYWRQTDQLEEAADAWLKAAEYGAAVSEDDTAHALYCAAEAFDAAGKAGDARLVCTQLAELYAESPWTARAYSLLGL